MSGKREKLILCAIVLSPGAVPVIAKGPTRRAGNSNIGHLYHVEKNPADLNRPVVPGGDYTLIYYHDKEGDPWPRTDIICLGSDRANEDGDVHIRETADTGDLPNPETDINEGAKLRSVLSDDVDCDGKVMFGSYPTEYLFEYNLIAFDSTMD